MDERVPDPVDETTEGLHDRVEQAHLGIRDQTRSGPGRRDLHRDTVLGPEPVEEPHELLPRAVVPEATEGPDRREPHFGGRVAKLLADSGRGLGQAQATDRIDRAPTGPWVDVPQQFEQSAEIIRPSRGTERDRGGSSDRPCHIARVGDRHGPGLGAPHLPEGVDGADAHPGRGVVGRGDEGRDRLGRADPAERDQHRRLLPRLLGREALDEQGYARGVAVATEDDRGGRPHAAGRVRQERADGRRHRRVGPAPEAEDRLAADAVDRVGEEDGEGARGVRAAQRPERARDRLSHLGRPVAHVSLEGAGRPRIGEEPQGARRARSDMGFRVVEQPLERFSAFRSTDVTQRLGRTGPDPGIRIREGGRERLPGPRIPEDPEGDRRRLPESRRGIAHREEERGDVVEPPPGHARADRRRTT